MQFVRRLPLSRLLALCAAVVAVGAAGTALADALGSASPPPATPLAQALHDALAGPSVAGVSARITFTNSLLDASSLQTADSSGLISGAKPLLTGASGRMWASDDGRIRIELQSNHGDTEIVKDGRSISMYDSGSNTLYRYALPSHSGGDAASSTTADAGDDHGVPTVAEIQRHLDDLSQHELVGPAVPGVTGGVPSYTVRIAPKANGGLIDGVALSWDAGHGVPLSVALYSTGSSSPVLALSADSVSYGPVDPGVFTLDPPGVKVQDISPPTSGGEGSGGHGPPVTGAAAVQAQLPFALQAPATLAGRTLDEVRLVHLHGRPAALVTYGHGLDGLALLEQAGGHELLPSASVLNPNTSLGVLPHVSVNGAAASELATAIGTLLSWQSAGVGYTLAGSVTNASAEAAANGL
jgi:outer membrane lipoprotein-sorting protein